MGAASIRDSPAATKESSDETLSGALRGSEPTRADASGGDEGLLQSRSPPLPHLTQDESPARQAAVLFGKNTESFKSKAGPQIGRKIGLEREDPFHEIAKLDHPVSREIAGEKIRGPGTLQAMMHAANHLWGSETIADRG
jgi:hypothetical protein